MSDTKAGAPKLKPGTPMTTRGTGEGIEAKTPASKWHRIRQWWAKHHLDREPNGEWKDESGWGSTRRDTKGRNLKHSGGLTRDQLREDIALGKHAQNLREEAATKGGKEERAAFYGTGREHVSGGDETRLQAARYERQLAEHNRAERERSTRPRRGIKW